MPTGSLLTRFWSQPHLDFWQTSGEKNQHLFFNETIFNKKKPPSCEESENGKKNWRKTWW